MKAHLLIIEGTREEIAQFLDTYKPIEKPRKRRTQRRGNAINSYIRRKANRKEN